MLLAVQLALWQFASVTERCLLTVCGQVQRGGIGREGRLGGGWRPGAGQLRAESARIGSRIVVESLCQSQRTGIRSVLWRLMRTSWAGMWSRWRQPEPAVWTGPSGMPIWVLQRPRVVRQGGDHRPGAADVHPAGGEVAEGLVDPVADRELDVAWSR